MDGGMNQHTATDSVSVPRDVRTPFWAVVVGIAVLVVSFRYLPWTTEFLGMGAWGLIALASLELFFVQVLWSATGHRLGHYLACWGWVMLGTAIVALVNGYLNRPLWFLAVWLVLAGVVLLVRAARPVGAVTED